MPARATLIYLAEKYMHETQFENYLMDMLWAPANGMQYKQAKRYNEMKTIQTRAARSIEMRSGDDIVESVIGELGSE